MGWQHDHQAVLEPTACLGHSPDQDGTRPSAPLQGWDLPGWDHCRNQTIHDIDWDHSENDTFRVIIRFRVDEPCVQGPIEEAIDQLRRYANQRSWAVDNEGNVRLFRTYQFRDRHVLRRGPRGRSRGTGGPPSGMEGYGDGGMNTLGPSSIPT